jgi:hypothetical protein
MCGGQEFACSRISGILNGSCVSRAEMEICNTVVPIAVNGRQAAELVIGIARCGRGPVSHDGR